MENFHGIATWFLYEDWMISIQDWRMNIATVDDHSSIYATIFFGVFFWGSINRNDGDTTIDFSQLHSSSHPAWIDLGLVAMSHGTDMYRWYTYNGFQWGATIIFEMSIPVSCISVPGWIIVMNFDPQAKSTTFSLLLQSADHQACIEFGSRSWPLNT